jgi:hypothetical protein
MMCAYVSNNHKTTMEHVDEDRLDTDVKYRFHYNAKFIGFGANDISLIQEHKELLEEITPLVVRASMERILTFDATKKILLGRVYGYQGALETDLDEMDINCDLMQARLSNTSRVMLIFLQAPWDDNFLSKDLPANLVWRWGNKLVDVALVHNNNMYAVLKDYFLEHILNSTVEKKTELARSVIKLFCIVNDLSGMYMTRTFEDPFEAVKAETTENESENESGEEALY